MKTDKLFHPNKKVSNTTIMLSNSKGSKCDIDKNNETNLIKACRLGNMEDINILCDIGNANIQAKIGMTAIMYLSQHAKLCMTRTLRI